MEILSKYILKNDYSKSLFIKVIFKNHYLIYDLYKEIQANLKFSLTLELLVNFSV